MSAWPDHAEWSWAAEVANVTAARHAVVDWLCGCETPDPRLGDVALVISEAVTNAVTHAYVGRAPGDVHVRLAVTDDELVVVVEDDGNGLRPRPDSPGLGYGLALMVSVSDRFEAQTVPGTGTRLSAWFSRGGLDVSLPAA